MVDITKKYIETLLIPEIVKNLDNEELVSFEAEHSSGIDGFMSTLYHIKLNTKTNEGEKQRSLIAKFMRGNVDFRESSKSYIQFANEIYTYGTILPTFEQMLRESKIAKIQITDWVPCVYKAEFGYIEGLSSAPDQKEAALVLENLQPMAYKMGPLLTLKATHLKGMCTPLAQYHACSYALRILNNSQFQRLKEGIIPLPFIYDSDSSDPNKNLYVILYRLAFDRFYDFIDRQNQMDTFGQTDNPISDLRLRENLNKMREKYYADPVRLMERLRVKVEESEEDSRFAVILHGDYNRNNVLFKYCTKDNDRVVEDVKMIDFQELRYGSPALDLSFFMYFNTSKEIRSDHWLEILQFYQSNVYSTLETILKGSTLSPDEIDKALKWYNFDAFYSHFSNFAFYGAMICIHFLPWMLCSEADRSRLSDLFASDMCGEEFRKLFMEAGGDEVNMRILDVIRHASDMGYMDNL